MQAIKKLPYGLGILLFFQFLFFFTVLLGHQNARQEAANYYFDSGLYQIEFPTYVRFLQKYMSNNSYFKRLENINSENLIATQVYWLIFFDPFFQNELKTGDMLKKSSFYNDWFKKREVYNDLLKKDNLFSITFNSYKPEPSNILFSLFATGNHFQFLVNCIFLLITGIFLERKAGSLLLIESFLVGGIVMLAFYCLLAPYCLIPLTGSNGGVASLVGLTTSLLFSWREITFSSILALVILPIWILTQYTLFLLFDINFINVVTQIPAILGGMLIGFYVRQVTSNNDVPGSLAKTPEDLT